MVPVSRLPDLCLLALFRQMTLEDQIDARKVCRRWADLVPEVTSKRRKLTLFLGKSFFKEFKDQIDRALFCGRQAQKQLLAPDGTAMYPIRRLTSWNTLRLDSLDQITAEEIASTFIGANELQVTHRNASSFTLDNLAHLLELWSGQLTTLQLFGNDQINTKTTTRLFAAINGQSALTHLHLRIYYMSVPDLSILSKLEELRFYSARTTTQQFTQWLHQYGGGNRNLARIEYHDTFYYSSQLEQFTALSEHIRRCFTRFSLYVYPILDAALLSVHFSGLTTLNLSPSRITVRQLFSHLPNLRQLIHLYLTIDYDSFIADDLEDLLPQVESMKALDLALHGDMPIHQQLAQLKLPWTLPNIEVIHFEFTFPFQCTECNIYHYWLPSVEAKSCLRKLFAPLKRDCTKLRLIEHNEGEAVPCTAEEILAE